MPTAVSAADEALHAAGPEGLHRRLVDLALERTGARHGALFLWDEARRGLVVDFHVVEGLVVDVPDALFVPRKDGRPNGIALHVQETGRSRLVAETREEPHYAPYLLDVRSLVAVPIPWQRKTLGVLTVSAREPDAFDRHHLAELETLARSAARFLRRAALYRHSRRQGRPFFIQGLSPEWLEVERRIERVSDTDAPVLVTGESGTGKELVANAIHFNSRRAGKPFVTVNCAAIPEAMLESVLFGHVKGAFTGASFDKVGEFRKADGGTLFLDELGELPRMLQAKLLRALEQGEIQPLGSNRAPERVDVRFVSATNRDLPQLVREGAFRDDLFHRVSLMTLELPPLRSYKAHLEVLAHVFRARASEKHGREVTRIAPEALELLAAYPFPGNVRELKNAVEHAVILAEDETIRASHLPRTITGHRPTTPAAVAGTLAELREQALAPAETAYLRALLAKTNGKVREAAKQAGVDAVTMYRLLKKRAVASGR